MKLESLERPRHRACQPCHRKPEVFLRIPDLQTGAASAFQRNYIFQLHIIGQTIFFAGDKFIKSLPYGDAAVFPAIIRQLQGFVRENKGLEILFPFFSGFNILFLPFAPGGPVFRLKISVPNNISGQILQRDNPPETLQLVKTVDKERTL